MFRATNLLFRNELLLEEHYVKTIYYSFAGVGVCLRESNRPRIAIDFSSTDFNSARQRDDERLDSSFASESTSGLGVWSQRHIHRHH